MAHSIKGFKKVYVLWLLLLLKSVPCKSQASLEFLTGSDRAGVDVIAMNALDSLHRWTVSSRNQAGAKYDGVTSLHSLSSAAYSFRSGVGIVTNAVFTPDRFYPALGIQYTLKHRNVYVYAYLTKEVRSNDFHDHFLLFVWQPYLRKNLRLLWQDEFVFQYYGEENAYSFHRLKLGVNTGKMQTGCMIESGEKGAAFLTDVKNTGLFVKMLF